MKRFAGNRVHVESAGLEPAEKLNPLVVEVMKEDGFDLSQASTQSVFELSKQGKLFNHVITVCHDGESKCPIFPGITKRWHWPFPDPAAVEGDREQRLEEVRRIRDMIKNRIAESNTDDFSSDNL